MKKNILALLLVVFPICLTAQKSEIKFLDELSKEPIIGLQIFSENGSFISNTNAKGLVVFDVEILKQGGVKSIIAYNTEYVSSEYKVSEIPAIIYLKKNETIQLDDVTVTATNLSEYFTVKAYFRSWKLKDGALIKYGDGLVNYHVPYAEAKDNFNNDVKSYFCTYRTFNAESVKQKSRVISISFADDYLNVSRIPQNDGLKNRPNFKVALVNESFGTISEDGNEVGYVTFDKNNNATEIITKREFDEETSKKILFWKISGKSTVIEKWTGEGSTRHPTYLFSNSKKAIKVKGEYNYIETVTEIFIDNTIIDGALKAENSKKYIDQDRSYYKANFWEDLLKKHPLPSEIKAQLTTVNENKNTFKSD